MRRSDIGFILGRIINDGVMTFVALLGAYYLRLEKYDWFGLPTPVMGFSLEDYIVFSVQLALGIVLIFGLQGRYQFRTEKRFSQEFARTFWGYSSGVALLLVLFYFIQFPFFSRFIIAFSWVGGIALISLGRLILRGIRSFLYHRGFGQTTIMVLGTGSLAENLITTLTQSPEYAIVGVVALSLTDQDHIGGEKIIGHADNFEDLLQQYRPHQVILATEKYSDDATANLSKIAHRRHAKFSYVPNEIALDLATVQVETIQALPIVTLHATQMSEWGLLIKGTFDRLIALIGLIVLSPLMLYVTWRVKKECPQEPAWVRIKRVGKGGKLFPCYKFRSMVPDAHKMRTDLFTTSNERQGGVLFKMKEDPRVTPFGKFIRRTSLDELPQLWNVVRGEMSLIGPRPHLPEEVAMYPLDDLRILAVKPGITGYAQLHGREDLPFAEEAKYETYYMQHWSIWLDIVILVRTIMMVLRNKNNAS